MSSKPICHGRLPRRAAVALNIAAIVSATLSSYPPASAAEDFPYKARYDKKLPDGATAAVCKYWAKLAGNNLVIVDPGFLSARIASRMTAQGTHVERRAVPFDETPSHKDPKAVIVCYSPNYVWSWPGHGEYLAYQRRRFAAGDENISTGWMQIVRSGGRWQVHALSQETVPVPIKIAVCRDFVWKPKNGQKLHLYVDPADQIAAAFHAPYVDAQPGSAYRDLQWTDKAELEVGFDYISWIDTHTGLISFGTIRKPEKGDVAYSFSFTELVRYRHGQWKPYDFGILPEGE